MDIQFQDRFKDVVEWLQTEYLGIRSGQASPALLDSVSVESYGARVMLQHIGSVGIEDARTLRVVPWDSSQVSAIEKAIRDADLGVSVVTDSAGVRVVFPELTSERRVQILKLAKQKLEDARVSVRGVRDEVMKAIDAAEKSGEMSEDEKFSYKEKVQKTVEQTNNALESLFDRKEQEISK
jgi:ribosome recycling factor